jgi:aryl-alcohol dehydrogenase-like predicted oxidoreductase
METRTFAQTGVSVSRLGLGCMGMSDFYVSGHAPDDEAESIATIHRALDLGGNFLDTADIYGVGRNEELVGKAIQGRRDEVFLATKFGNVRSATGEFLGYNSKPGYVRQACEASLKRLNVEVIDLYYQHRVDRGTPIEDTVGAMAELVQEGKVRFLGLSEAGPETIRRAHAVTPSPHSRRNTPSGPAIRKQKSYPSPANWASPLCPTARWAAASSPAGSTPSTTSTPATGAATTPAFRAKTSSAIWTS